MENIFSCQLLLFKNTVLCSTLERDDLKNNIIHSKNTKVNKTYVQGDNQVY